MDQQQLLATIFDKKTVAILQNLLKKKDEFYLRDLSRESKVSLATTYRIVSKLAELGLVHKNKKEKTTEYKIKLVKNQMLRKCLRSLFQNSCLKSNCLL